MAQEYEPGDPEVIEAVMLHGEITDLFRKHDPAVLRGKNIVEFVSGRTAAPAEGGHRWTGRG